MQAPNRQKRVYYQCVPLSVAKHTAVLGAAEKSAAIAQVLSSRTFHKSDLLIKFLKYICEKEMAGEADRITEYSIATDALGRPLGFSPEADSSVRSRAHALRRKLEDCYRDELPTAGLRIVLPKGSYVPEFIAAPAEAGALPVPPHKRVKQSLPAILPAFAAGIVSTLLVVSLVDRGSDVAAKPSAPEVLRQAWGPLLKAGSEVLVVVAVPKQFWAREFPRAEQPRNERWYPKLEQNAELTRWFYDTETPHPNSFILLHPNVGSPLWGDTAGAVGAVEMLSVYGIKHQVLPERVLKPYVLRGRNVLLFGNPEYSPAVRQLLKDAPFRVEYDPVSRWEAIVNTKPRKGEPDAFRRVRSQDCLGVLTVIAGGENDARSSQIVVFSGLTSAGTQAAQEFFASPTALADLAGRFKADGAGPWPRSFQVVVEASIDANLPIQRRYKAHRVMIP